MISIYKHNLITINYDMKNKLNSINYDFSIQTLKGQTAIAGETILAKIDSPIKSKK